MSNGLHIECTTCGKIGPEEGFRSVPTFAPAEESYVDGCYCDEHATGALDAALAHIAGLDFEHDDRDDMMPLMMLLALLRARDQREETLAPDELSGEGMERIRTKVTALLRRIADGVRLPIVEANALCTGCYRPFVASQVRIIPCHNESVDDYVTSFRCGACFRASVAETKARVEGGTARDVAQLGDFFGRHGTMILEHRRGDPVETVRPLVLHLLDMLAAGSLRLSIGETVPLEQALGLKKEEPPPSKGSGPPPEAPKESAPSQDEPPSPPTLWSRIRRAFGRKPS
jgi:hypothetical protein